MWEGINMWPFKRRKECGTWLIIKKHGEEFLRFHLEPNEDGGKEADVW